MDPVGNEHEHVARVSPYPIDERLRIACVTIELVTREQVPVALFPGAERSVRCCLRDGRHEGDGGVNPSGTFEMADYLAPVFLDRLGEAIIDTLKRWVGVTH